MEAGEKYRCIKDVRLHSDFSKLLFIKDNIYTAITDSYFINEHGDKHFWDNEDEFNEYFAKENKMTKVIVIGQPQGVEVEKKKIEFVYSISGNGNKGKLSCMPKEYLNIELICKDYSDYDIMFAYDNVRADGCLYLGHWNDGIV